MKIHSKKVLLKKHSLSLIFGVAVAASSIMLPSDARSEDARFSGESTTIIRMRRTIDKQNLYPLYEYLRFAIDKKQSDNSGLTFYLGAWGKTDLADKSGETFSDADLQYGYLSYRGAKNNLVVNLGRQFVTEGVAADKVDGLYIRNDFAAGIGAAVYAGKSVKTEVRDNDYTFVYGGRLTQSMPKYYTIGGSILKSDTDGGAKFREEFGGDLWIHPMKQLDLTGKSTYNNITKGWMEHSYKTTITPADPFQLSLDVSNINYHDYFYGMTNTAFDYLTRTLNPDEKMLALGAAASFKPMKNLTLSSDFRFYGYEKAGDANYYGAKAVYSIAENTAAGLSIHRMNGKSDKFRYTEYRAFASKNIAHADFAIDFTNINFDQKINDVRNSYSVTGSAGYECCERLKIGADIEYAKNPDFDNEVRGLVKLTYMFDTDKRGKGGKHEK